MAKKYKIFRGNIMYRGKQIDVRFYANSQKEAAAILNTQLSYIRDYFFISTTETKEFEGILAFTDRSEFADIWRKEMPLEELKKIIDERLKK